MNRRNRSWYGLMMFLTVGAHLLDTGASATAWALLALNFLIYPQLAYWWASRAADQSAAELRNLALDAVLIGMWAGVLGFPVWITFVFLVAVAINMTVFSGRRGFVAAFGWMGAGAGIAVLAAGFRFLPLTGWPATLLSIAAIAGYVFAVANSAYERTLKLQATREQLRSSEQALLRQLAENTSLQEQLRDQANQDPLTGLYNRRYLDSALERELIRCRREGELLSLVLIDIDHFKQINDQHGHLAGDQVIRQLAALLGGAVRGSDIACRYGGEEFLLMLPGLSQEVARVRADAWRTTFGATPIQSDKGEIPVTFSAGIATLPMNGTSSEALFRAADDALYRAKQQGRNRVMLAGPAE